MGSTARGTSEGGAPLYKSPERLLKKEYGPPADVYSFGILFWYTSQRKKKKKNFGPLQLFEKKKIYRARQILTRDEPFRTYQEIGDVELFKNAVVIKKERLLQLFCFVLGFFGVPFFFFLNCDKTPKKKRPSIKRIQKYHLPQLEKLVAACWDENPENR